jgi:hypothetical protein
MHVSIWNTAQTHARIISTADPDESETLRAAGEAIIVQSTNSAKLRRLRMSEPQIEKSLLRQAVRHYLHQPPTSSQDEMQHQSPNAIKCRSCGISGGNKPKQSLVHQLTRCDQISPIILSGTRFASLHCRCSAPWSR